MLNENIKRIRKSKGLSQEELAIKLNVVRQTVSKWENGLSVPDSSMLIILANELDTTVSELLGEPVAEPTTDDLKILSEKLEVINLQLAKRIWRRCLFMKKGINKSILFYVVSALFLIASAIGLTTGNENTMAIIWLSLGSAFLCLGSTHKKKENNTDDK